MKRNLLKGFFIFSLLAISSQASAQIYYGLNVGGSYSKISKYIQLNAESSKRNDNSYIGLRLQGLLGYRYQYSDNMDIGVELNANYTLGSAKESATDYTWNLDAAVKESIPQSYGIFVIPRWRYNEKIDVLAGLGLLEGRLRLKSSGTNGSAGRLGTSGNFKKWNFGYGFKLGVAFPFSDQSDLEILYEFDLYKKLYLSAKEPNTPNVVKTGYKTQVHSLMVSYIANFA